MLYRKEIYMFTKKDRLIANQKIMIENRDKLIEQQCMTIECLKEVINSLEEDLKALKEEAFKNTKKRTSRPRKSNQFLIKIKYMDLLYLYIKKKEKCQYGN